MLTNIYISILSFHFAGAIQMPTTITLWARITTFFIAAGDMC